MSFKFDNKRINPRLTKEVERIVRSVDSRGVLRITQMGEAVLRNECADFNGDIPQDLFRKLIAIMKKTMREAPGVGLAAPQIDLGLKIAVIEDISVAKDNSDVDDIRETSHLPFFVIINPKYVPLTEDGEIVDFDSSKEQFYGTRSFYEGCLSFHDHYAIRERYHSIRAYWTDEKGRDHEEDFSGWPARIFQHETDHLYGEIYIDKAIIRSLSTADNLSEYELDEDLEQTAKLLNFEM